MPIYQYRCEKCGHLQDAVRKIDQRHHSPECDRCETVTNLIISPVRGIVVSDMNHYDPGLGMAITSPRQLAYEREKRGLIDARELWGEEMPDLPPPPPVETQAIPGELYDAMQRQGLSDMLDGVEIDHNSA